MPAPTATSADVAAIIPERCLDPGGDFTVNTNPTLAQVQSILAAIVEEVSTQCGASIDATLTAYATLTVATGAAAQIELAFTNDISTDTQSKYEQLWSQYQLRMTWLAGAQEKIDKGGAIGQQDPRSASFVVGNPLDPRTRAREQF